MMKIGVDTESLHLWFQNGRIDIFGFIDLVYEMGFDGVMINLLTKKNQTEGLGALGKDNPGHICEVAKCLQERGMFVELATKGTDVAHIRKVLDVASILGAKTVRTYIAYPGGTANQMKNGAFDRDFFFGQATALRKLVPLLEEYKIDLAVENHELETCGEMLTLLRAVGSRRVGALFDSGNPMMAWEEPVQAVHKILPYIKSTHIKDQVVCLYQNEPVICGMPLGKGNIDLGAIYHAIQTGTELDHMILEICSPYASPFRRERGTSSVGKIGEGTFKTEPLPFAKKIAEPLDYYNYEGKYLPILLWEQYKNLQESLSYLQQLIRLGEQWRVAA